MPPGDRLAKLVEEQEREPCRVMSTVYTHRLAAFQATGAARDFTVPAGRAWVVRDVSVLATTGNAADAFACFVNGVGPFFGQRLSGAGFYQAFHWVGYLGMAAGEVLELNALTGGWSMLVTGYDFAA